MSSAVSLKETRPVAGEYTAFAVDYVAARSIDLTLPPFASSSAVWMHVTRYDDCQRSPSRRGR